MKAAWNRGEAGKIALFLGLVGDYSYFWAVRGALAFFAAVNGECPSLRRAR